MPKRDPHTIAVAVFGVAVLLVGLVALNRVFNAGDALAAGFRQVSEVTVSSVSAEGTVDVVIQQGAAPSEIIERLADVGVAADGETLETLILLTGSGSGLQAGEYTFALNTPPAEIVRRLVEGPPRIERITFRAGLRVEQIGLTLEQEGYFTRDEWDAAVAAAQTRDFQGDDPDFLGYLMPGTYEIKDETTAASLLEEMLDRFDELVTPSLLEDAEAQDWTLYEVLTLASVVEREAVHPEEKPAIAAAFRNRINQGIALQADPTVQFALTLGEGGSASIEEFGWWKGELTIDDLALDSPYNTYIYPGLMPGPIANPDIESIEAVIRPADVEYLYFVASPECDGRHLFASTLDEHNANVELFRNSGCIPAEIPSEDN
ncbi:MAG: endolytic transglycosylase MltG [Dehalococcoidia bacterium]|nr:endolytic transglycosylase MltG [Dehalococcoidia bacterium]